MGIGRASRSALLVLVMGAAMTANVQPAWAVCAVREPAEISAAADVIFVGRVTSVSGMDATFDVIEVWKGHVGPVETVHRGTEFEDDPRYEVGPDPVVVFASATFGGLRTITCTPQGSPDAMAEYRPDDAHPPATGVSRRANGSSPATRSGRSSSSSGSSRLPSSRRGSPGASEPDQRATSSARWPSRTPRPATGPGPAGRAS